MSSLLPWASEPPRNTNPVERALYENLALIKRAARCAGLHRQDIEDGEQVAAMEFLHRLPHFDPTRGVPLAGFMWPYVSGAVRHYARQLRLVRDHELPIPEDGEGVPVAAADKVIPVDVDTRVFLASVGAVDRTLLFRRFWKDETLEVIAASMAVSRQTVHIRMQRLLRAATTYFIAV